MQEFGAVIETMIPRLRRGTITRQEFENELLYSLTFQDIVNVKSLFKLIPEPHHSAIANRLKELHAHEFKWEPFFIGPGLNEQQLDRLSNRLREIYAALFKCE